MSIKEERAVRAGVLPLDQYVRENTMAAKLVKHRYAGALTDRTTLLTIMRGHIQNYADSERWERGPAHMLVQCPHPMCNHITDCICPICSRCEWCCECDDSTPCDVTYIQECEAELEAERQGELIEMRLLDVNQEEPRIS